MLSPNLTGAFFMAIAMAAFTFNDAIVKLLSDDIPIPQIIFLRGIATTVVIVGIIIATKTLASVKTLAAPLVWWRALMEVGATYAFLTGLKYMPIGNAAAILSALPLAVTIGSALFLKERVGWRRWLAIVIGFIGVLIIVRPGFEGFNEYSALILVCVVFAAARDLFTKQAPKNIPSLILTLSTSIAITVTGAIYTLFFIEPVSVTTDQHLGIAGAAAFLTAAYFFIVAAMRVGDVGFVAPFRYTNLIWAIGLGILLFGDELDKLTILGAALVVATGIFTLYRERLATQKA